MSSAAKIDYENYFALLATSLKRFSIPALGTFVWHVERAEVDPRTAQIKPPRSQLKYEPGQRYLSETITFLMDRYGLSHEEVEIFLKELGNILLNYLKAAGEMDVWKLGKLRRAGVSYRMELSAEAPVSFLEDLQPVSLRATEGAVAPVSITSQPTPSPPQKKTEKTAKEKPSAEAPRARTVEITPPSIETRKQGARSLIWVGAILLVLVGIGLGAYFILRKREKVASQPVEVVLGPKGTKPSPPSEASNRPPLQETGKSTENLSTSPPKPEKPAETKPSTSGASAGTPSKEVSKPSSPKADMPSTRPTSPTSQQPTLTTPQKGRYYIIVGSYPSIAEAREKAKALGISTVEFLPGKEAGWVRVSYFSSTDRAAVQARLTEIKARIPDAWVYAP